MAAAPRPYQAVGHPVRAHRLRTGLIVALLAGYTLLGGLYVQTRPVAETGRPTLAAAAAPHQAAATPAPTTHIGLPSQLHIDSIALHVAVKPGAYYPKTEDWALTSDAAHYASESVPLNDTAGTTLLYGHDNHKVFMPLFSLQPGALATVTADNGQRFTYRYDSSTVIGPTDTAAISNRYAPSLVLMTCSGPNYSRRTLFNFSFVRWETAP
jgi:LPXTG-site transpeptidase (sortase) family protein